MTFTTFMQKYNVKSNFLQYYSLLSATPQEWKTMLKQECLLPSTEYVPLVIEKLTCKTIYNTLLNHQHLPPATAERRLIECGFIFQERQKIYSLPFRFTSEVKLSVFRYKIVHNILYTNKILYKIKKKQQPDCPYCHDIVKHHSIYLWNAPLLNPFGINLQSGTTLHVEETWLWSKTKLYMVF